MKKIADAILEGRMCQYCVEHFDYAKGSTAVCTDCQIKHNVDQHGRPV